MPNLDDGPQMELIRDVWDLDDDQLQEALEPLQMETARREGQHPIGSPQGNLRVHGGSSEANMDDGEMGLRGGGDGDIVSLHSSLPVPLKPMWMSAASSACLWLG